MLLTYSLDRFVSAIKSGTKIHTIREDPHHRWRAGMSIQHWRGNPRNVRSNPYPFGVGECKGVQEIQIHDGCPRMKFGLTVMVDNRHLTDDEIYELATNDGLTMQEFRLWFLPDIRCPFFGRIIHFTEKMY